MHNDLPRPVFILGVRKSGGRLLQYILSTHSTLSTISSPVVAPRTSDRRLPKRIVPNAAHLADGIDWPTKLLSDARVDCFAHPAYQPSYRLTEADVEHGDRERFVSALRARMADSLQRVVHYDPPYLVRARYLQALFPDAFFVLVVRDPYANVAAAARCRSKWGSVEEQALHWSAGHDTILGDRRYLKRRMIVHYEQLAADPIQTLEAVCHFCRMDFEPELLKAVDLRSGYNDRLISTLDQRDLRIVTRACRRTMTRLGYEPRDKAGALPARRPARATGPETEPRQAA
jgi:hypothetical protein